jgi:hypothetical protein
VKTVSASQPWTRIGIGGVFVRAFGFGWRESAVRGLGSSGSSRILGESSAKGSNIPAGDSRAVSRSRGALRASWAIACCCTSMEMSGWNRGGSRFLRGVPMALGALLLFSSAVEHTKWLALDSEDQDITPSQITSHPWSNSPPSDYFRIPKT